MELRQLESSVAVRSLEHRNVRPYALEPHDAVHPATFDGRLALQHESELDEELGRRREVVNHDADVVHPLDRHAFDGNQPDSGRDLARIGRSFKELVSSSAAEPATT